MTARLEIRLYDHDVLVQDFTRVVPHGSAESIKRMTAQGLAWLRCYSGQISDRQWAADTRKAAR